MRRHSGSVARWTRDTRDALRCPRAKATTPEERNAALPCTSWMTKAKSESSCTRWSMRVERPARRRPRLELRCSLWRPQLRHGRVLLHLRQPSQRQRRPRQTYLYQPHLRRSHPRQPHLRQPHLRQPHLHQPHLHQLHLLALCRQHLPRKWRR